MTKTKYQIHWRSKINSNATGHGQPVFDTHNEALKIAMQLDDYYLIHWVEAVEVEEGAKTDGALGSIVFGYITNETWMEEYDGS